MYRTQIHYYAEIIKIRNSLFFSLHTYQIFFYILVLLVGEKRRHYECIGDNILGCILTSEIR